VISRNILNVALELFAGNAKQQLKIASTNKKWLNYIHDYK